MGRGEGLGDLAVFAVLGLVVANYSMIFLFLSFPLSVVCASPHRAIYVVQPLG